MLLRSAEANTSAGAPSAICATKSDDDAKLLSLNPELTSKFRKALVSEYNARQAAKAAVAGGQPAAVKQDAPAAQPPKRFLRTI